MASFTDTATEKTTLISPVSLYAEWKGGKEGGGFFQYYDKDLGEKQAITFDQFIVLKTWYNVQWFVESLGTGVWSNEVDSLNEDLIVSYRGKDKSTKILTRGKYADIKNDLKGYGLSLHRVVHILADNNIVGIALKGSSSYELNSILSGVKKEDGTWTTPADWRKNKIKFNGAEQRKKGAVTYFVPIFVEGDPIGFDEMEEAKTSASIVDAYFEARRTEQKGSKPSVEDDTNDLPF
jgi:hypothetical protein